MFYYGQPSSTTNWPSTSQYSDYHPDRRLKILWFLGVAAVALILSVASLIVVFTVDHSWFDDSYNQTYPNQYGLWRLCLLSNQACDSWFSTNGLAGYYIQGRLNQARVAINAWQALEIVFLFLTASALIVVSASILCYRIRKSIHLYLAILAAFCIWPAACVGISGLFVFGFSVYSVSTEPRNLDWCFYLNIAAVVLSIIAAILLTVYDILLKKPFQSDEDDTVLETFGDLHAYSAAAPTYPSTFVVVRQNKNNNNNKKKKKKSKADDYQQVLHPNQYFPTGTTNPPSNTDFVTNPNFQKLSPAAIEQHQLSQTHRGTGLSTSPSMTSMPPQTRYYQPPMSTQPFQPPPWQRTEPDPVRHNTPPMNDYVQRGIYRPTRLNPPERTFDQRAEPRMLHYYTGHDHFSSVDPSDVFLSRPQRPMPGTENPIRYLNNPPYYS